MRVRDHAHQEWVLEENTLQRDRRVGVSALDNKREQDNVCAPASSCLQACPGAVHLSIPPSVYTTSARTGSAAWWKGIFCLCVLLPLLPLDQKGVNVLVVPPGISMSCPLQGWPPLGSFIVTSHRQLSRM